MRVDQYQGADAAGLEEKVKQHTENDPGNNEDSDIPKGYVSTEPPPEAGGTRPRTGDRKTHNDTDGTAGGTQENLM